MFAIKFQNFNVYLVAALIIFSISLIPYRLESLTSVAINSSYAAGDGTAADSTAGDGTAADVTAGDGNLADCTTDDSNKADCTAGDGAAADYTAGVL